VFRVEAHPVSSKVAVFDLLRVNVTAIRAGDGLVLVDTHRSPASMKAIARTIHELFGELPVTHVINTHGHWDHTSGNQLFGAAEILGHVQCPELMRRMPATWGRTLWGLEQEAGSPPWRAVRDSLENEYSPAPPRRLFKGRLELEIGGLRVVLIDASGAHSDDDVLVYLPDQRIVLTGDILCSSDSPCFPVNAVTAGSRVIEALDEVLTLGVDSVIPGHGPPLTGANLRRFRDVLWPQFLELAARAASVGELEALIPRLGAGEALRRSDPELTEEELDRLGWRLFSQGGPDDAIQLFDEALSRYPDSALLHDSQGELHFAAGNLDDARSSFSRALDLGPWNQFARYVLDDLAER
jgi:glyoxylase-like metal-dependent hydrolase (beta-lactamase superfamily II)